MTATPPETNPIRWAAQRRRHWANPTQIKPNIWLVEEGSGPRATVRRLAVVEKLPNVWTYRGHCQVHTPDAAWLELNLGRRSWKVFGPSNELIPMLTELAEKYA